MVDNADVVTLGQMMDAGMDVARVTFHSNKLFDLQMTLQNIRMALSDDPTRKCKVLVDIKQSEMQVKKPKDVDTFDFEEGQKFDIISNLYDDEPDSLPELKCAYDDLYKTVYPGQVI